MRNIKILVVGEPGSIHTSRFVSLLQRLEYDVRIFQCEYRYAQDEHLSNTKIYVAFPYAVPENSNIIIGYYSLINPLMKLLCRFSFFKTRIYNYLWHIYISKKKTRTKHLIKLIRNWQPDVVFSLKMQNDGYTVSEAKDILGDDFKPKWIHFSWGTDIEFFGKHPEYRQEHLPKIKKLLSQCDFHIADCKRDVRQAIEYGLKGISLGDCVAQGGFALDGLKDILKEAEGHNRNYILIKGRQGGYVGKAFNILQALHKSSELLTNYKIKIFLATPDVKIVAAFLEQMDGVDYEIIPHLPYRELLGLYARSRIAISATDVDGTPAFLLEAMAMGAMPIHSDMESIREWIDNGVNGLLFPVDDISALFTAINQALKDDELVLSAKQKNWSIIADSVDSKKIEAHLKHLIENKVLPPNK